MYWETVPVAYPKRRKPVDMDAALRAEKSSGDESCIFCDLKIPKGAAIVSGEHRIGTKLIGKTVRVETHLDCAKTFKSLIDLRIRQAELL